MNNDFKHIRTFRKKLFKPDVVIRQYQSLFEYFDNVIKEIWYINDKEYDYLAENLTKPHKKSRIPLG